MSFFSHNFFQSGSVCLFFSCLSVSHTYTHTHTHTPFLLHSLLYMLTRGTSSLMYAEFFTAFLCQLTLLIHGPWAQNYLTNPHSHTDLVLLATLSHVNYIR